jgi:hypothetical protein
MDRKNINRGFNKLRVWQDAVSLYVLACKIFANLPFERKKVAGNSIDAAHSISRNISETYCRVFHKDVFCALRSFSKSKRGNPLFGNAMIAMKVSLFLEPTKIFMEKPSKLIPKPLLQIRKLFGFDHYSIVPLFHHSIGWHYSKWHQNKRNVK